ncbi:ABC transporter substrate-binding protein [Nonomuraea sp. MCN248]|uniref:ABC transporter substrate-binding protein n=1 Tax=Nonomuraea corallina TaxID=2989783 RepID=A0ABT4S9J0_9ACTN|nr:ABC transporter substrate-binding protein [Nonomuraea corallina]MDA0633600.1 ABC transporter substrate-binding protein [Nonomuraea corallina]
MTARLSLSRRVMAALAVPVLALALTACGAEEEESGTSATDTTRTLKVGYISGTSLGPAFVADALGCYRDAGLTIEFEPIKNPADAIAFLATDKLDVYVGSPSAGMFNQVAKGAELKMVASLGSVNTPEGEAAPSGLFAAKSIKSVEELKGKRVALLGTVGSATSYLLGKSLEAGGLTFSDVELVPLGGSDMVPALKNGGVEAALLFAPETQKAIDQDVAHPLVDSKKAYGSSTTAGIMYGPKLLNAERAAGVSFLKANACAVKRFEGDWRKDAEIVKMLADFMKVPENTISGGGLYAFDSTLAINEQTLTEMQNMFMKVKGTLTYTEVIPPAELVDDTLRTEALGQG